MGKKSRRKMTGLTPKQRIERSKKQKKRDKIEEAKRIAMLIKYKLETDAKAREQLMKAFKGVVNEAAKN